MKVIKNLFRHKKTRLTECEQEFTRVSSELKTMEAYISSKAFENESLKMKEVLINKQRAIKVYVSVLAEQISILRYDSAFGGKDE